MNGFILVGTHQPTSGGISCDIASAKEVMEAVLAEVVSVWVSGDAMPAKAVSV